MLFIGIDLAWSTRNASGVAVIEGSKRGGVLKTAQVVYGDDEIINFVQAHAKEGPAIIAIDAPLIVPNKTGRRIAEVEVGNLFRKYNAGAHPANRERLSSWTGSIRGEEISRKLERAGFKHDPFLKQFKGPRAFLEVYPHPSMVVLFNLEKVIPYKAKPKRDYPLRWSAFEKYVGHMRGLARANPALKMQGDLLKKNVRELKGKALKNFEDVLDGVFCAYIAYYGWARPSECKVLGSMKGGYIFTPVFAHQRYDAK